MDRDKNNNQEPEKDLKKEEDKKELTPDPSRELLDKIIQEYREKGHFESEKLKVAKVRVVKLTIKHFLLSLFINYLFDLLLSIALNGYLAFAEYDLSSIVLFSIIFTTVETILRHILTKYSMRLVLMSFGMITIPITIISFVLAVLVTPGLVILSTGRLILFFIIFMIIRLTLRMFFLRRSIINQQRGTKK
ncbi:MAG: hypothetical protein WBL47_04360 [Bacilli bacterium]|nr:hypothetical protein [Bacillota bacterium]NLM31198.1 hypothetical protein [Acholeplasmataceae bacterium]HOA78375.1 hypothetical protein [Bacilli bacterium]HPZ27130.1 hypothetical protein [Bacilli bacterium]HQC89439.1 hypothetical protein [Bacilli bacterium]